MRGLLGGLGLQSIVPEGKRRAKLGAGLASPRSLPARKEREVESPSRGFRLPPE